LAKENNSVKEATGMKKNIFAAAAFMCSIFIFSSVAVAHAAERKDIAAPGSEISDVEAQIRIKRSEVNAVEDKITALRRAQRAQRDSEQVKKRAEKQTRLEELRLKDPVKYQREKDKQFEQQKLQERARKERIEERSTQPKMSHAQWLEKLQKKNPKMYELVVKKDALQRAINALKLKRDAPQGATSDVPK
jgi:hypothetical protein